MKIALAQINVRAGYPELMFSKIKDIVQTAKEKQVKIIAFPEMIFGYLVGDKWLDDEYCQYLMSFNDQIKQLSENICIIYGNIYLDEREYITDINGNKKINIHYNGKKRRYNTAYVFQNKKEVIREGINELFKGKVLKSLLPNYRYFDDKRYFTSPLDLVSQNIIKKEEIYTPFIINGHKIGVEICEECWSTDYFINPTEKFEEQNTDIIINISASPWTCEKNKTRDKKVLEVKTKKKSIFAYVNCVGSQMSGSTMVVFDGASTVYEKDGKPRLFANSEYEEELLIFNSEKLSKKPKIRKKELNIPRKHKAIIQGIRGMSEVSNITKYVCGVSGGVDSSLVLCLLSQAVGQDNIIAINMPSKYNSQKTKKAAKNLCKKLGIKDYRIIPINNIVNSKIKTIFKNIKIKSLTKENVQAETRGMILSTIAGEERALFTCNANKNEIAIGYGTLNGDLRGGICPIADLTKREVYDMVVYINKEIFKKEIIPEEIFPNKNYQFVGNNKIKPSAELKHNQIDPIKIGFDCALIDKILDYKKFGPNQIMRWWIDGILHEKLNISKKLMKIYKVNEAQIFIGHLKWLINRMQSSVFKRLQSPPVITLTKSSYGGFDFRETLLPSNNTIIENIFNKELEQKVLNKKLY